VLYQVELRPSEARNVSIGVPQTPGKARLSSHATPEHSPDGA
jgi:hypothetical protein